MNISSVFHTLFVVFLIAGIIFLAAAIVVFFVWKIPKVFGQLSGSTAKKEIAALNAQNAATGNLTARTAVPVPNAPKKTEPKKPMPTLTYDETEPLSKERQRAIYKKMQESTGVVPSTEELQEESGSEEPTKGLRAENLKLVDREGSNTTRELKDRDGSAETMVLAGRGFNEDTDGETEVLSAPTLDEDEFGETALLDDKLPKVSDEEETAVLSAVKPPVSLVSQLSGEEDTEDLEPIRFEIFETILLIHTEEVL